MTTNFSFILYLYTFAFCAVGPFVIPISFAVAYQRAHLMSHGISANAVVINRHIDYNRHGNDPTYRIRYQFLPISTASLDNKAKTGESTVIEEDFDRLQIGSTAPVVYLAREPDISQLAISLATVWHNPYENAVHVSCLVIALIGGILLTIFISWAIPFHRQQRLVRAGYVVPARIIDRQEVVRSNRRTLEITYQFEDHSGTTITAVHRGSARQFATYGEGTTLNPTVLYDPDNSSENLLYPPSMIEATLQQT